MRKPARLSAAAHQNQTSCEKPALIAGIELGGTKCICILATSANQILAERRVPTTGPQTTLGAIKTTLEEWTRNVNFGAIGVASFGPLDLNQDSAAYGLVLNTPKAGWAGADLLLPFRQFGIPVAIDTDVNGAALAEGRWGAARGLHSFAYVTVGTGVGVGSIVHGRPVSGLGHSEAGHMVVPRIDGASVPGNCPFHSNCVEGFASGPAIALRAGVADLSNLPPTSPAWDEAVGALAGLFHNLVLTTVPQRIVVGGGVGLGQPHLLKRVRAALDMSLAGYAASSELVGLMDRYVVTSTLGDLAGPLGAIAIAQQLKS